MRTNEELAQALKALAIDFKRSGASEVLREAATRLRQDEKALELAAAYIFSADRLDNTPEAIAKCMGYYRERAAKELEKR